MKRIIFIGLISVVLTACGPSAEEIAIRTQGTASAIVANWTETSTFPPTATPTTTITPVPTNTVIPTVTPTPTPTPFPNQVSVEFKYNTYATDSLDLLVSLSREYGCEKATYYAVLDPQDAVGPIVIGYTIDSKRPVYLFLYLCEDVVRSNMTMIIFEKDHLFGERGGDDNTFLPYGHWGEFVWLPSSFLYTNLVGDSGQERVEDFNCRWALTRNNPPLIVHWVLPLPAKVYGEIVFELRTGYVDGRSLIPVCDH